MITPRIQHTTPWQTGSACLMCCMPQSTCCESITVRQLLLCIYIWSGQGKCTTIFWRRDANHSVLSQIQCALACRVLRRVPSLTIQAISHKLFNAESLSHAFSTHFEPLYTNIYHVGPSDGAVLRYVLRLKIYGATSVFTKLKNFTRMPQGGSAVD